MTDKNRLDRYHIYVHFARGCGVANAMRLCYRGLVMSHEKYADAEAAFESYLDACNYLSGNTIGLVFGVANIVDVVTAKVERSAIIASECPGE